MLRKTLPFLLSLIVCLPAVAQTPVPRGLVDISPSNTSGSYVEIVEGGTGTFTITRTNADLSTSVEWIAMETLYDGPPTTGFSPSAGMVTLAAGQSSKTFTISTQQDSVYRAPGYRWYCVMLMSATNGYVPKPVNEGELSPTHNPYGMLLVHDSDLAVIDFATRSPAVREDAGMASLTLRRTGNVSLPVTLHYDRVGTQTSGNISFAASETEKTFQIPIENNTLWTGNRNTTLQLSGLSAGSRFPESTPSIAAQLTIQEDEPTPVITMANVTLAEGNSGRRSGSVVLKITPPVGLLVGGAFHMLPGTAEYPVDYVTGGAGLVDTYFSFDGTHSQYVFPFEVIGDTLLEPDETFRIHVTQLTPGLPIQTPADATVTILDDETNLTPDIVKIARAQSMRFSIDIGLPAAASLTLTPQASDPSIVKIPSSIRFNAGQSAATFDVTGNAPGTSRVSITLPSEHGGQTLSSLVTVFEGTTLVVEPNPVTVFTGEELKIRVSLKPASSATERLQLSSANPELATVPGEIVIPPGGPGTFTVKGVKPGATYATVVLPPLLGGLSMPVLIDVIDRPPTPAIVAIEPSSGDVAGGTPFIARGSLLTADCRLLFGDAPATSVALSSDGMLIGSTPAHAAGAVDVTLQCGSEMFVLPDAFTYTTPPRRRSARH
jgi:hypothetical protein